MKILTDDPDWARDIYEARALAVMFVRKHGCALQGSPCLRVVNDGLTVTFYPNRSPMLLTIDAPLGTRVLSLEWNDGDAWRIRLILPPTRRCSFRGSSAANVGYV
jgi:hypothetical protein